MSFHYQQHGRCRVAHHVLRPWAIRAVASRLDDAPPLSPEICAADFAIRLCIRFQPHNQRRLHVDVAALATLRRVSEDMDSGGFEVDLRPIELLRFMWSQATEQTTNDVWHHRVAKFRCLSGA